MRAALRAQTAFRRHSSRRKFLSLKGAALALQCATRWRTAVAEHRRLKREFMATKLQSWHRMLAPWKAFRKLRSASLALQCRQRQRMAYGELRDLRIKAKDVGNLKEDNERLKQQVLELRESASRAAASAGDEQVRIGRRGGREGGVLMSWKAPVVCMTVDLQIPTMVGQNRSDFTKWEADGRGGEGGITVAHLFLISDCLMFCFWLC